MTGTEIHIMATSVHQSPPRSNSNRLCQVDKNSATPLRRTRASTLAYSSSSHHRLHHDHHDHCPKLNAQLRWGLRTVRPHSNRRRHATRPPATPEAREDEPCKFSPKAREDEPAQNSVPGIKIFLTEAAHVREPAKEFWREQVSSFAGSFMSLFMSLRLRPAFLVLCVLPPSNLPLFGHSACSCKLGGPLGGSKEQIPLRVPKNDPIKTKGTIWGFYFLHLPRVWGEP